MAVTIKQLAAKLGMHPSTVSRALNDHPSISESTKVQVKEAARRLSYEPNPVARGLAAGHTGMIGFLVVEVPGSFMPSMIDAANRAAAAAGLGTILSVVGPENKAFDAELDLLRRKRVDGLLVHRYSPRETPALKRVIAAGIPIVFAGGRPASESLGAYVAWDEREGARIATEHLASLGYERVAFFGIDTARAEGYREVIRRRGLEEIFVLCRGGYWQQGYLAAERLLRLKPLPRAVACFSDWIAYGLLARLGKEGLRVPEDVAVVGQDDLWVSSLPQVKLSSVHHPRRIVGERAVAKLLDLIDGGKPESELVPGRLVVRGSCGGQPRQDDLSGWRGLGESDY